MANLQLDKGGAKIYDQIKYMMESYSGFWRMCVHGKVSGPHA
jgi:hypothetical protein